jgi:hypothetical protein
MSNTTDTDVNDEEHALIDLTRKPLDELVFDGDTVLDKAVQDVVAGLTHDVFAGFGNAPRPRSRPQ